MNNKRKVAVWIIAIGMICSLASCVVAVRGPHRHYWHHGPGFHRIS